MRKKTLEKRLARLQAKKSKLAARALASQDANEVRSINDELEDINADIEETQEEINAIDEEKEPTGTNEPTGTGEQTGTGEESNTRAAIPTVVGGTELRGINPLASYSQTVPTAQQRGSENYLDSIEYRTAFANYVKTGNWNYEQQVEQRAASDGMVTTADIGRIIPNTILNEVIKNLKSYGNLYTRVRKLNVKGGVEIPIQELIPTVKWITETEVSENQSAPEIKQSVMFGYHICEARLPQSLLSSVVALEYLEIEIAALLAEAFAKEYDRVIISGSGAGQPLGILKDTRVKAANKITMSAADAEDWTKWRKNLFAKIPISYRAGGVLVMTVDTWESLICTMKDANNRPLYSEVYNVETNTTTYRFNGKEVMIVENDLGIMDYSTANAKDVYMLYFKPTDYAMNDNQQIGYKRYFNEESNKWINKGLSITDGKLLDVNSVFIISK